MNSSSVSSLAALALALVFASAAGCAKDKAAKVPKEEERDLNRAIVNSSFAHQITAGARVDRTVYPHHFIVGEAALNELGRKQIDALTSEVTTREFQVNIPRSESDDDLHEARVQMVRDRLAASGVEPERIAIVDEHPGGPGLTTAVLVSALEGQGQGGKDGGNMWGYSSKNTTTVSGAGTGGTGGSSGNGGGGSSGGGSTSGSGGSGSTGSTGYGR